MADLAVWQRTIVDEEGNVIPGAEIEVRREEDGSLATLYADRAGETPLANPLAADMSGFVRFFAQGDAYTITAVGAGSTRTWRFDPTGRLQEFDRVSEALNADGGADIVSARANLGTFSTVADVQNSHIPAVLDSIRTNGYYEPGDGGGALYKRVEAEPDHPGKLQSADGAWWEYAEITVNVLAFGAKGDDDADDYGAFQAAFDCAANRADAEYNSVEVFVPAGTYRLSKKAICAVSLSSAPGKGTPGIVLRGQGSNSSYLVATPDNSEGLIELTSDRNSELWQVREIGFLSDLDYDAVTTNGTALEVNSTLTSGDPGYGEHPRRTVIIEEVYVGGYGAGTGDRAWRGNFAKGIYIARKWWPYLNNVYVRGGQRPNDDNPYVPTGRTHAIHTKQCYSPEFGDIQVTSHYTYGIVVEGRDDGLGGNDFEDFRLRDSFLVGQDTGFQLYHSDDQASRLFEPGGSISNTHINSRDNCIHLRYHRQIVITGCYLYLPRGVAPFDTGLHSGVWLDGAHDITIAGCQFLEPGFYTDDDNASVAIRCSKRVSVNIVGCTFNHGGIGVLTDAGTTGRVYVSDPILTGARTPDWADFTPYLDHAGIMSLNLANVDGGNFATYTHRNSLKSVGGGVRHILQSDRDDYATNSNPTIGSYRIMAPNSDGSVENLIVLEGAWLDNSSDAEESVLRAYVRHGGNIDQVLTLRGSDRRVVANFGFAVGVGTGVTQDVTLQDGTKFIIRGGIITGVQEP